MSPRVPAEEAARALAEARASRDLGPYSSKRTEGPPRIKPTPNGMIKAPVGTSDKVRFERIRDGIRKLVDEMPDATIQGMYDECGRRGWYRGDQSTFRKLVAGVRKEMGIVGGRKV